MTAYKNACEDRDSNGKIKKNNKNDSDDNYNSSSSSSNSNADKNAKNAAATKSNSLRHKTPAESKKRVVLIHVKSVPKTFMPSVGIPPKTMMSTM
ncbi:hypothetical protein PoB_002680800 [Plakobranchus ocellatus]|uniref:Uncharacterized protein n=1 Tax=Plakobranchus ocellatus TaxID=259542 RepID=A0AAV4A0P4_9GAST|nr:hypothetical protein PoB_002680800 [Plakobranchus ocellatus]